MKLNYGLMKDIFGVGGAGFERFNLAMPRCLLVQALDNLYQALKNRQLI